MKLLVIYLYALTNAGHYEFVHSVMEFAQKCAGVLNRLPLWFEPFKRAVEEEERLMAISLKSVITEQLAKLDGQRDGLVTSIKGATNAMLKSLEAGKAEAAQRVMNELVSLKVDINDNYMNQTGQIDTLVTVLLGKEHADIETLGLDFLVQELKNVNDLMHALLNQRDQEQFDRMNDTLAQARKRTDAAYDAFIRAVESYTYINAAALAEDDEGFTQFVNDTNARIEYYRRYVLKLKELPEVNVPGGGEVLPPTEPSTPTEPTDPNTPPTTEPTDPNTPPTTEPGEPNTPGGGTTEPQYSVATFNFFGGRSEELRQLVGSLLNAPANTEGYRWVPAVPSTMPATNTTYNEEAVGEEKYTVAWYLPNGNPIIWYELAPGETIPEAPTPPEGYYWHPYPSVMPNHDLDINPEPIQG